MPDLSRLTAALLAVATPLALAFPIAPAHAQFASTGYNFLKAVKDRDGQKAIDMLGSGASTLINTRDQDTGDSALHIVVARRDLVWINFLLQRGADANQLNRAGETPLIMASQLSYVEGIQALVAGGADVNATNGRGETALHLAVQRRDLGTVRALIALGANPDLQDNVAGMSARDYATRDPRATAILAVIQAGASRATTPNAPVAGPR